MMATQVAPSATKMTIPTFVPSGNATVDDMNRERIAIFELGNLAAQQDAIQTQMQKCLDALAAPLK